MTSPEPAHRMWEGIGVDKTWISAAVVVPDVGEHGPNSMTCFPNRMVMATFGLWLELVKAIVQTHN